MNSSKLQNSHYYMHDKGNKLLFICTVTTFQAVQANEAVAWNSTNN